MQNINLFNCCKRGVNIASVICPLSFYFVNPIVQLICITCAEVTDGRKCLLKQRAEFQSPPGRSGNETISTLRTQLGHF